MAAGKLTSNNNQHIKETASYPDISPLKKKMDAQGTKGTRTKERRLADYVLKMADSSMADDRPVTRILCGGGGGGGGNEAKVDQTTEM